MLVDWSVSIRRACEAQRFDTSSYHCKSRRAGQAGLELRIKEICETRVRYGYRRGHVLLRREGWRVKAKLRDDRDEAIGPKDVWAMHSVHDQLALGNKLRILTVVDTHSRFCPATDARFSFGGEDVVQPLKRVCHQIGHPKTIRVDNGSQFISRDLDLWAYANAVTLDFSRPGKPTGNGFIAAFNRKPRSECLNARWFMSLADAREKLEAWPLSADCDAIACRATVDTITKTDPTARSDTMSRLPCIIPTMQPASRRDQGGKL